MSEIEFSRRVKLDEISAAPGRHSIAANEAERRLLAERFALPAIERLEAEIDVSREAAGVRAKGRVRAAVTQECVVSGQPVAAKVDEPFEVLFAIHSLSSGASEDEVELGEEDCDVLPMDGDSVDIGELAAETVSLVLDPYPRLPDDALAEYRRLLTSEEEAQAAADAEKKANNPFAVLKKGG